MPLEVHSAVNRSHRRGPSARIMAWALIGSLASLAVTSYLTLDQARRAAKSGAIDEASRYGEFIARDVVASLITPAVIAGDAEAIAAIDDVVEHLVDDGPAVRVKVWSADSRVLYSDEKRLIGQQFELEDRDLALLNNGGVEAGISELERPENLFEDLNPRLLEVYVGTRSTTGDKILIESYFNYSLVADRAGDLRDRFVPILLVALAVLALVQIPVAVALASRFRREQRDRHKLLERLVSVSDSERRRIAAEVHDGAVQDLAGVSFTLGAVAQQVDGEPAARLRALSSTVTATVRQLRSLLTSIYPVEVPPEGVGAGLEDLVDVLRSQGARVTVDISRRAELRPAVALIVLRVGRELLRNVIAHAQASEVTIKLRSERGIVVFELVDDGVGFSAEEWERRRAEGHLGLALLVDLVTDAGGRLDISSEPGEGMRARLELVGET